MSTADEVLERIRMAFGPMIAVGPRGLRAHLEQPAPDLDRASSVDVDRMIDMLLSDDPNTEPRLLFSNLLRTWDNAKDGRWTGGTTRNSVSRRKKIHEALRSGAELEKRIDTLIPFYHLEEPVIIAQEHRDWYEPKLDVRDYYWTTYQRYLRDHRRWHDDAILNLENSTRAIIEYLADPESPESYASRGLVMGYVQSGKTANFLGVVARAADAGYRLIIVLAGTWNILRNQTQRRFDKELLGKQLLNNDETYTERPPADWDEFLDHGSDPAAKGHYIWQRLTRPDIDFRGLRAAIDHLEFERVDKSVPLYNPANLHSLPAKLLVIKKHSTVLRRLVKDLKLLRTQLTDLPALIIDDESDQAGVNTADPTKKKKPDSAEKERSRTNERIVELLGLFPRGQYVGYTATPYANALIDADDPEDLFPKDFIVSLDRPRGYMGISDFFDPETDYDDLDKEDYSQPEVALIRRVSAVVGKDDPDLRKALLSYVLAGAIKLYRHAKDPDRYKAGDFKHHTMLVHTSHQTGEHESLAQRVKELWDGCALNGPKGRAELKRLWQEDYERVCLASGSGDLIPPSFDDLIVHLSEAIKRIELGQKIFLVLNSESADAPDFSAAPVWKVILGGNKLSRGYTIEGLTVSYYRRVAGAADTLMQMGRWFGFRPGYRDLVRVFLGVKDGRQGNTDLVALFKEICRMEERFRQELKRYVRRPGVKRVTPKDIRPLITVFGSLPPTAANKRLSATVISRNFGEQFSMLTRAPTKEPAMGENIAAFTSLVSNSVSLKRQKLGGMSAKNEPIDVDAVLFEATNESVITFLEKYHWLEADFKYPDRPPDVSLQIEFLQNEDHGITSWLIVAPQRRKSFGKALDLEGVGGFTVKERQRVLGRGFQVFGEPAHRTIARYLAEVKPENEASRLVSPGEPTQALKNRHRGILLLYPVRQEISDQASIGFELLFPANELPFELNLATRTKG